MLSPLIAQPEITSWHLASLQRIAWDKNTVRACGMRQLNQPSWTLLGIKIASFAGATRQWGYAFKLLTVSNGTDLLRSFVHHASMRKHKAKKGCAKTTLSGVRREMAKPRVAKSARKEEPADGLKTKGSPSRWF
jgi:hypothetical protein